MKGYICVMNADALPFWINNFNPDSSSRDAGVSVMKCSASTFVAEVICPIMYNLRHPACEYAASR